MTFIRKRKMPNKKCKLCAMKIQYIDYKDLNMLGDFVSEKGKIMPKRINGNCAKHQRMVRNAVQRARHMCLVPYTKD
ncbi:MAG TPA: 30S ribosomal protein S18 [Petrotogaceae bacterium]|jgi:small subunit ribosomal protein S18|nr:30S ribosomal protein S18 [Petrotogaceae bacterium]HNY37177.1 30S ribosomal protein S18 [Petrotogaceae bacterium]HOG34440.1 30S ribosomal protein S18 [Petrotogaceae bacterium]HOT32337.1 30S ribosomal protein S18 [Petrotogaceae bacterium]HPO26577.1 30S ribosomal protein S18 [Petrotogaceae bacterium]